VSPLELAPPADGEPLVPPDGGVAELEALLDGELEDDASAPPAGGALEALGGLAGEAGGVDVALLLELAGGVAVLPALPVAAGSSFLLHAPNVRVAIKAPSNSEYFIFMWCPLKWKVKHSTGRIGRRY